MKNGRCPKCEGTNIIPELRLKTSQGYQPFVSIVEPEPSNRPFVWKQQYENANFLAYVCGDCGYTEFYADNFKGLSGGQKKGFRSS